MIYKNTDRQTDNETDNSVNAPAPLATQTDRRKISRFIEYIYDDIRQRDKGWFVRAGLILYVVTITRLVLLRRFKCVVTMLTVSTIGNPPMSTGRE